MRYSPCSPPALRVNAKCTKIPRLNTHIERYAIMLIGDEFLEISEMPPSIPPLFINTIKLPLTLSPWKNTLIYFDCCDGYITRAGIIIIDIRLLVVMPILPLLDIILFSVLCIT